MSKEFKPQDYFRYKKLGIRWRKPKGRQGKQRIKKGTERMPAIGYRSPRSERGKVSGYLPKLVTNSSELSGASAIIISSKVGAKKVFEIFSKAKEMGIVVLNKNAVKKYFARLREIEKKKEAEKSKKKKEKKEEKAKDEKKDKGSVKEAEEVQNEGHDIVKEDKTEAAK